jgi:hypothetical protein
MLAERFVGGDLVGEGCGSRTVEQAKTVFFAVNGNPSAPFFYLFVSSDAFETATIKRHFVLVGVVGRSSSVSKVAPSVVRAIHVGVVNLMLWPFSGHVEPCRAVRVYVLPVYEQCAISESFVKTSGVRLHDCVWCVVSPLE